MDGQQSTQWHLIHLKLSKYGNLSFKLLTDLEKKNTSFKILTFCFSQQEDSYKYKLIKMKSNNKMN